ncbi:MAG: hypothetical protein M0C28_11640 [Candidatus Moduliflexus flocculans]|nr:hypothetical protein [Candidatus Moduliflexus flocculans]
MTHHRFAIHAGRRPDHVIARGSPRSTMLDTPRLLLGSLLLRPYVFAFLGAHLVGASALLGWRRTSGVHADHMAAWRFAAEASSIRTGIPFGWYYYLPSTGARRNCGSPASRSSTRSRFRFCWSPATAWRGWLACRGPARRGESRRGPRRATSSAAGDGGLFVLADVVIDPVALRGDRWFLGRIYGYPEPGLYFGIPRGELRGLGRWSGWWRRALYHAWERRHPGLSRRSRSGACLDLPRLVLESLAFNLTITFALQEWWLGLCGASARAARGGHDPAGVASLSKAVGVTPRREGLLHEISLATAMDVDQIHRRAMRCAARSAIRSC